MHYVVMDLEWNQAMSSKSSVFNKLPIHLRGEIIEIGAVKLNEDMTPGEEFKIDVKPVYFKRMHYKVKKLTGFDRERLAAGVSFPEALAQFRAWCGDDVTFLTWGCDDQGILDRNGKFLIISALQHAAHGAVEEDDEQIYALQNDRNISIKHRTVRMEPVSACGICQ